MPMRSGGGEPYSNRSSRRKAALSKIASRFKEMGSSFKESMRDKDKRNKLISEAAKGIGKVLSSAGGRGSSAKAHKYTKFKDAKRYI